MGHRQNPKRHRSHHSQVRVGRSRVKPTTGLHEHDERLRISRPLGRNRSTEAVEIINYRLRLPGEAPRQFGALALDIIGSEDMFAAIKASSLEGLLDIQGLMRSVREGAPSELSQRRTLYTTGIEQFGNWIGIGVVYPGFSGDRSALTTAVDHVIHTEREWPNQQPHLRLREGDLEQFAPVIATLVLPETITLQQTIYGQRPRSS